MKVSGKSRIRRRFREAESILFRVLHFVVTRRGSAAIRYYYRSFPQLSLRIGMILSGMIRLRRLMGSVGELVIEICWSLSVRFISRLDRYGEKVCEEESVGGGIIWRLE